ncbi:major centromere autoantigen B-like, partial [Pecten maximus]|uniref:major centromere autoantigen B-like n=1 Tax=Pecten maximus TaxID=6579 RepID=UPI0014586B2B
MPSGGEASRVKADFSRIAARRRFNSGSKYGDLNELTLKWFSPARARNLPISGPLLQEKAMRFASDLGLTDYKASSGWLTSFKERNSIGFYKVSGESGDVDPLDLGIIRAFKARYRKRLMSHLLAKLDSVQNATEMTKCVTVLDCVYWISASWNETTDITVKTCFMQAGFPFVDPSAQMYPDEEIVDDDDDIPLALLRLTNIDLATAADIEDELEIEDNSSDWETTLLESVRGVDPSDSDDESETEDESNNETDLCYGD